MFQSILTNFSNIVPVKETASTGLAIVRRLAGPENYLKLVINSMNEKEFQQKYGLFTKQDISIKSDVIEVHSYNLLRSQKVQFCYSDLNPKFVEYKKVHVFSLVSFIVCILAISAIIPKAIDSAGLWYFVAMFLSFAVYSLYTYDKKSYDIIKFEGTKGGSGVVLDNTKRNRPEVSEITEIIIREIEKIRLQKGLSSPEKIATYKAYLDFLVDQEVITYKEHEAIVLRLDDRGSGESVVNLF